MASAASSLGDAVSEPPTDGITACRFAHASNSLAVSSWDCTVRVYDALADQLLLESRGDAPVLDTCFRHDDEAVFSGGVDATLMETDLTSQTERAIGAHDDAIRCVEQHETGVVVTGSWDRTLRVWDPRARTALVSRHALPGKAFSMATTATRVIVGTSGRHVHIYDVRRMAKPEQVRESSLVHQTRCIRAFPDGVGYVLSSIEGRVSVEYLDPSPEAQARKYAFKGHRSKDARGAQTLFPVNALAFHPRHGTFASGGSDGRVYVWDPAAKKRICSYQPYPTSISYLDFNADGSLLAVAASYTFEEGEKDHPTDAVYVRAVREGEVRPKQGGMR